MLCRAFRDHALGVLTPDRSILLLSPADASSHRLAKSTPALTKRDARARIQILIQHQRSSENENNIEVEKQKEQGELSSIKKTISPSASKSYLMKLINHLYTPSPHLPPYILSNTAVPVPMTFSPALA